MMTRAGGQLERARAGALQRDEDYRGHGEESIVGKGSHFVCAESCAPLSPSRVRRLSTAAYPPYGAAAKNGLHFALLS